VVFFEERRKMKKEEVVKKNREFEYIINKGECKKNSEFVIYYIDNDKSFSRYGISVSKKIGNAVTRNYYKRVIRNICDKSKKFYSNNKDYIIIMRKGLMTLSFNEAYNSLNSLLQKINN